MNLSIDADKEKGTKKYFRESVKPFVENTVPYPHPFTSDISPSLTLDYAHEEFRKIVLIDVKAKLFTCCARCADLQYLCLGSRCTLQRIVLFGILSVAASCEH